MKHGFSLAKSRIGIYINMPDFSWSAQIQAGMTPNPRMLKALKAAFDAFQRVDALWQDIATAPKDGSPVLLWAPGWATVNRGWWEKSLNGGRPGWTDGTVISFRYEEEAVLLPTMWAPLIDPPQETEKSL